MAVCGALSNADLPRLAELVSCRKIENSQRLIDEGDVADEVFTVTSGMLRIYKLLPDGRRQITGFLTAGDFVGLVASEEYAYSAEAIGDVELCRFNRKRFLQLLATQPALENELLSRASNEIASAQAQMLLLGRKTARERLATFLIEQAKRQELDPATQFDLPMSRSDIADYLGLTIETVSRTFTNLRKAGVVATPDAHSVCLLDFDKLEEMVEE